HLAHTRDTPRDLDDHTVYQADKGPDDMPLHAALPIFLDLRRLDARVIAVVAGEYFEQQRIVFHGRGHRAGVVDIDLDRHDAGVGDRKSTRLNSSHVASSYAVFCLNNKIKDMIT